jgi:ribosomal protein L14E/L6E/L27E
MFALGQVVFSKSGRDKGLAFIVSAAEEEYIYLIDGRIRPIDRPKKKKIRHVQPTYHIDEALSEKLKNGGYFNDADVRKALSAFNEHR